MATGSLLRGPIPSGLKDLPRSAPRCRLSLHRPTVAGCVRKSVASVVSGAARRLSPHHVATGASARRHPCPTTAAPAAAACSRGSVIASATVTAAAAGDAGSGAGGGLFEVQRLTGALIKQASRFWQLSGKFMPMVGLFFMLAFVNTILDSLKDTLVITAVGGGAQVIPYLTVYAVLPSSLVFLLLYSYASQRFRRQALFNGIVGVFMAFFVAFAYALYPNHHLLHPTGWADGVAASLPLGLDGAVGMVRNWTFTLFFCMSELWGDVCLGLLFWGLANDTTSLADAPTLYPLFGLGANVAQALAGFVLKFFSGPAAHGSSSFTSEVQSLMGVVLLFSVLALALHHGISMRDNQQRAARLASRRAEKAAVRAAVAEAAAAMSVDAASTAVDEQIRTLENQMTPGSAASTSGSNGAAAVAAAGSSSSSGGSGSSGSSGAAAEGGSKGRKGKQNLSEIYRTLASSVPIRCLVVMSMAQGLCTNLMEFAWKSHIRLLYPTPAEFTSFLGDVSTWQGIVTGLLMVLSPTMFERMGWAGVAAATPRILLYGGGLFFAIAMFYQFILAPSSATAASAAGLGVLQLLVYGGALLYVFSKSAKFSLFKPAEEMVYISLDEEGRTKGKAAIDVVGSQAGKSGGSVLQQVLLLLCGGAIAGQLPAMVAVYLAMSQSWLRAVATLSTVNNYGHASSVHESMQDSSMNESSLDEPHHHHQHHHDHYGHNGDSHNGSSSSHCYAHQDAKVDANTAADNVELEVSRVTAWVVASGSGRSDKSDGEGLGYRTANGNVTAVHVTYQASNGNGAGVLVRANGHHVNGYLNGNGHGGHNGNGYGASSQPSGHVNVYHSGNGSNDINGNGNGKYVEQAAAGVAVRDSMSAAA